MTREEAKEILKTPGRVIPDVTAGNDEESCRYNVENKMAIETSIMALEQEPKTGHWILDETDNSITCDKCGCLIWANDIINGDAYYCPNCGCRMESEG